MAGKYSNGPSRNLSWKELACKDGTPYPKEFILDGTAGKLSNVFEGIRSLCGSKPIFIVSAYRTPSWNRRIGGVKNSQHIKGRALDLRHSVLNNDDFHRLIRTSARALGVVGLGKYKTFVHIDIRPSNRLAQWDYEHKSGAAV
jgi:hypothetical protein